jgi:hypothetical protein
MAATKRGPAQSTRARTSTSPRTGHSAADYEDQDQDQGAASLDAAVAENRAENRAERPGHARKPAGPPRHYAQHQDVAPADVPKPDEVPEPDDQDVSDDLPEPGSIRFYPYVDNAGTKRAQIVLVTHHEAGMARGLVLGHADDGGAFHARQLCEGPCDQPERHKPPAPKPRR